MCPNETPPECFPRNPQINPWKNRVLTATDTRPYSSEQMTYILTVDSEHCVNLIVLYPTINSKGISCFCKAEHGAIAGVILFFTCGAAVVGPLAMGAISDSLGDPKYGFILATGFAGLLSVSLLLNWIVNPTRVILRKLDMTEYQVADGQEVPLQAQR